LYNYVYTPSVKEVNLSASLKCVYPDNQVVFAVEQSFPDQISVSYQ